MSYENWQTMSKDRGNFLFWGDKFLVITIFNSQYMACLLNATLRNDGNVPGITL